ncbi:PKD domain-containing protein [Cohnella candidum]|uniref:PKD/Chitinase domain-containing protein n=1 Tax=Cohnella candidum TaxID=2674991 RepID=A0A3G3JT90_9BACL|nr:PKD domain-containing protein [Cohnella candidum]AYQ71438.1 hypothetical protein EAV92_01855 [Cohnella candidum]
MSFNYSTYPYNIGVGSHTISLKIVASCGDTGWIASKTLNINGPSGNSPPVFEAGWTIPGQWNKAGVKTRVPVGTYLDLVYLDSPAAYDPDGDVFTFIGFDFSASNAWAKDIPLKYSAYTNGYHQIRMDTPGYFCGKATMRDVFGADSVRTACVEVVPPNPVPIITGPTSVVEGRPVTPALHADQSYSPLGLSIDHSRDIWTNKRASYPAPGTEVVTLEVFDSSGLKSLQPATHTITVKPDEPPVPSLQFTPTTVRGQSVQFKEDSYSPDGDQIVARTIVYRYDRNNDGIFSESSTAVTPDANRQFSITPALVGRFQFTVTVTEDWGKQAEKNFFLNVINDNPTVTFSMQGDISTPPTPGTTYNVNPSDLMTSAWSTTIGGKPWVVDSAEGSLSSVNLFNMSYQNEGVPLISDWKGVYLNSAAVTTATDTGLGLNLYQDYYLVQESAYWASNLIVKRNGVEVRRMSQVQLAQTDPEMGVLIITGGDNYDYEFTFKGFALGEAPVKKIYNGKHYWGCVSSSCFIVGNNLIQDKMPIRFNLDLKEVYSAANYPERWFYMNDYVNNFSYANPFTLAGKKDTVPADIPENATDPDQTIDWPIGYDSKGNLYYEAWGWHSGSPGGSMTFYGVNLAKLNGNTGDLMAVYDDGGQNNWNDGYKRDGYFWGGRVVGSEDGTKIAYTFRKQSFSDRVYRLIVRDEASGSVLSSTPIGTEELVIARYKNIIVTNESGTLRGRSFTSPATVLWSAYIGNNSMLLTTNGFAYGSVWGDSYLRAVDMETGTLSWLNFAPYFSQISSSSFTPSLRLSALPDGSLRVDPYYGSAKYFIVSGAAADVAKNYDVYGSFYSNTIPDLANFKLTYKVKFNIHSDSDQRAGFAFRAARGSGKNMYRVESSSTKTKLVKVVNGARTVLGETAYAMTAGTYYTITVNALFDNLKVYINGVPLIQVNDSTFADAGTFGPFTNAALTEFKAFSIQEIAAANSKMNNIALVTAGIQYSTSFIDTENDPEIQPLREWKFDHVDPNKFLNAGDGKSGLSGYDGMTLAAPPASLDKVGLYKVSYKVPDDPNSGYPYPSMVFDGYRAFSNTYVQSIIVHRRPIAAFSLSFNADRTVKWTDTSYDPDRWLSSAVYSTDPTGIDYRTTRGIMERKYYYTTPSGTTKNEKLVTPAEAGTYTVGLSVKDDYGAWSDWNEQTIMVTAPVAPDDPPIAGFTLSKTTISRADALTVTSTASDKEDGPAANLPHEYYIRNLTTGGAETLQSTSRGTWNKVFNSIGVMEIRQSVCDSKGQCSQAIRTVTVINRAPTADFEWSPNPVYEGDTVFLTNRSSDPDGDPLTYAWTISGPNGYSLSGSSKDLTLPGTQTADRPGAYRITLKVQDPSEAEASVTKTLIVRELSVQGAVLHTDAWEENRLRYNDKFPDSPRPRDWFWAGEAFVLEAAVTDTGGADTHAVSVEASATPELGMSLTAADSSHVRWRGLLRSSDAGFPLDRLPQGYYTFTFKAAFSNGVVKTSQATVRLKDSVEQYVRVHRVQ